MDASSVPQLQSRPDLVDLHALTGRWRLRRDAEGLPIIPGRRGHVAAHDLVTLAVYITGSRYVAKVLRNLPADWHRHQIGDAEANLLAPVGDLGRACRVVGAFRRRTLSPEEARRRGSQTQFRALGAAIEHPGRGNQGGDARGGP